MTIPYTLDANKLTQDGRYFARVRSVGTADLDTLVERMMQRGTTLGRADIMAALDLLVEVCIDLVLDGWRVDLDGLVRLYCSIGGTFDGEDDRFTPSQHTLQGVAQPGPRLEQALRGRGQPRKQPLRRPAPEVQRFTALPGGATDRLAPGEIGRLEGTRLRFHPAAADEGLFLIDAAGQAHRLTVAQNTARVLLFGWPALPPGDYCVEVRARVGHAATPRVGRLDYPLHVIESAG